MRYLDIGTTRKISKIGLGAWQFGSRDWGYGDQYAEQVAHAIVRRALELGVTLFDTAEIYGFGRSERILGKALGEDRESVFLATKILPLVPVAPVVEQRAVASAKRLGAHRLDLYQVHQPNPLIRDGTIMRGMDALQRVGLVDQVGVSNYSLRRWRAAEHALGSRVVSNQVSYSLVARTPERDVLPFAESHDRMVIAYSPLAQGLLTGKYGPGARPADARHVRAAFRERNLRHIAGVLDLLRGIGVDHGGKTPAQVALNWLIQQGNVLPIPGAKTAAQAASNAGALGWALRDTEVAALSEATRCWQR
jgi:aryl-alcohol dehydrogenase-like predicted oxidoreductase